MTRMTMGEFWMRVAASVQLQQSDADHGPAPDGRAWSGEWGWQDGTLEFRGAVLVPTTGFPVTRS